MWSSWNPLWIELNHWIPITKSSTSFSKTIRNVPNWFQLQSGLKYGHRIGLTPVHRPHWYWFPYLAQGKKRILNLEKPRFHKIFLISYVVTVGACIDEYFCQIHLILRTNTRLSQIREHDPISQKGIWYLSRGEKNELKFDEWISFQGLS